jgi:hypothetical protein
MSRWYPRDEQSWEKPERLRPTGSPDCELDFGDGCAGVRVLHMGGGAGCVVQVDEYRGGCKFEIPSRSS